MNTETITPAVPRRRRNKGTITDVSYDNMQNLLFLIEHLENPQPDVKWSDFDGLKAMKRRIQRSIELIEKNHEGWEARKNLKAQGVRVDGGVM
jgi:hypothetical protein